MGRLRLPRPQIATKLYGAIALTLAVVYALAAATTDFAGRTEEAARRLQKDGVAVALTMGQVEASLERQRRLVAMAPFVSDPGLRDRDGRAYGELTDEVAASMRAPGLRRPS